MAVKYLVYQVRFVTLRGTTRIYIGYTRCLDVRMVYHTTAPPTWLRCTSTAAKARLQYKILEDNMYCIATTTVLVLSQRVLVVLLVLLVLLYYYY